MGDEMRKQTRTTTLRGGLVEPRMRSGLLRALATVWTALGCTVMGAAPVHAADDAPAADEVDYRQMFGEGWDVRSVSTGEVSLLDSADANCHLKAYAWKLLGSEVRLSGTAWYPHRWKKWAWRLVVRNWTTDSITFAADVRLASDEDLTLDSTSVGQRPGDEAFRFGDIHLPPAQIGIPSGSTRTYDGTSWYDATAKEGEGAPASLEVGVYCSRVEKR